MSETYTVGGDTLFKIDSEVWLGQVFSPLETHTLSYIDLNIKALDIKSGIRIRVYYFLAPGYPFLDHLLSAGSIPSPEEATGQITRMRAKMTPWVLLKGGSYVIVAQGLPHPYFNDNTIQYDKDDATYPRGYRITSNDHGQTWTKHLNDDCIFAEFGTPPLPQPEPPPPIRNFAPVGVIFRHFTNAILIRISTSVPCHLYLYWTDKRPRRHRASRIVRGLAVPWGTYFCFVAWQTVEQEEPGDSLYHTFVVKDWTFEQVRWFTIRGEVAFSISPSVGAIFKHMHPGQDIIKNPTFVDWNPARDTPDDWIFLGSPGAVNYFQPSLNPVLKGLYSCLSSMLDNYKDNWLRQYPDASLLSNRTIKFRLGFHGNLTDYVDFQVYVYGDVTRAFTVQPTKNFEWEYLEGTLVMPPNTYKLMTTIYLHTQDPSFPFQNWFDDYQVYLE